MKKGDRIPGLIGWEYHGDPADIPGLEVVAAGTAWQGGAESAALDRDDLPRPERQFRLQCLDDLLGSGLSSPPGHTLPWSHWSRPHGPDERSPAHHAEPARADNRAKGGLGSRHTTPPGRAFAV